jgi:hypothetical protein
MLPNNTQVSIINPLDLRPQQRKPLPGMHQHTHKPYLRALRHGPQISHLEVATDASEREPPGPRHPQQNGGGENVDQRRRAPAVQVPHVVAEVRRHGQQVRGLGGGRAPCRGVEAEVAPFGVDVPVLNSWKVNTWFCLLVGRRRRRGQTSFWLLIPSREEYSKMSSSNSLSGRAGGRIVDILMVVFESVLWRVRRERR